MSIVHAFSGRVASGTEGITKNVEGLVAALQGAGRDARLASHAVALEALNSPTTHLKNAGRLRRFVRRAEADGARLIHAHANIASMGLAAPRPAGNGRAARLLHVWNALYRSADHRGKVPVRARLAHVLVNRARWARAASRRWDGLVVSSRFQKVQLEEAGASGPMHVVPNGIDAHAFRPASAAQKAAARRALGLGDGPVILYYGHLSFWKGVDHLVDALPRVLRDVPSATALFSTTGYGGGQERLKARLAARGALSRSNLHGPQDVPTLLAAADVVSMPWVSPVGSACYPNVLLESLASGLPVVASDVGCVGEVVRHGSCGLLVPPADPGAIADAVTALARDGALRTRIAANARRVIEERFQWQDVAFAMGRVYDALGVTAAETPTLSAALGLGWRGKAVAAPAHPRPEPLLRV